MTPRVATRRIARPLAVVNPIDPQLAQAREKVRLYFDPLWNQAERLYPKGIYRKKVQDIARQRAYLWLGTKLGITNESDCHIGRLDMMLCSRAYEHLRAADMTDEKIRNWAKAREQSGRAMELGPYRGSPKSRQGADVGANANGKAANSNPGDRRRAVHEAGGKATKRRAVTGTVYAVAERVTARSARSRAPQKAGRATRVTVTGVGLIAKAVKAIDVEKIVKAGVRRALAPTSERIDRDVYETLVDETHEAPKKKSKVQKARDEFALQLRQHGFVDWIPEHRFFKGDEYEPRQWRFDFAQLKLKVAVEIEGLVVRKLAGQMVSTGRHANISGFREDCRKYATAAVDGWTVLRFEQSQVYNREAITFVERVIARRAWEANKKVKRKVSQ